MNWSEGLRRLATGVTGIYLLVAVLSVGSTWYNTMQTYTPGGELYGVGTYAFEWKNLDHASHEAFFVAAFFGLGWAVCTVLWRCGRWVISGFKRSAPAE